MLATARNGEHIELGERMAFGFWFYIAESRERGMRVFPRLEHARIVRAWGVLRVLAPDEFPIYQTVPGHDGAIVATCHSGVSLAGAHALCFAEFVDDGQLPAHFAVFHSTRFDVPQTA
jgi:hydrogen cyanide synthase HcnC